MPGKLIGFKAEPAIEAALQELVAAEGVRSKSALVRRIAWDHVWANAAKLRPETRDALGTGPRVLSRRNNRR